MTLTSLMLKVIAGLALALCATAGLAAWSFRRTAEARAEEARSAAALVETKAGLLVAAQKEGSYLANLAAQLQAENASLRAQVAAVKKTAPKPVVTRVATVVTHTVPVPPEPVRAPLEAPKAAPKEAPRAPLEQQRGADVTGQAEVPCRLHTGEAVKAKIPSIELRDGPGNLLITGQVDVYRVDRDQDTPLVSLPFDADASQVVEARVAANRLDVPRAKWAVSGSALWSKAQRAPTGFEVGVERRLLGPAWLTAGVVHDEHTSLKAGIRWER